MLRMPHGTPHGLRAIGFASAQQVTVIINQRL